MNTYISDLFFNLDFTGCYTKEEGYDQSKLMAEAAWFVRALHALGVKDVPTPKEMVDNFMDRL